MKVKYHNRQAQPNIYYWFDGETITCRINEAEDTFDLSALLNGEMLDVANTTTTLPLMPIKEAWRDDAGKLFAVLLNHYQDKWHFEYEEPQWEVV